VIAAGQILALADRIAAHFQPQQIILFGSYAYGAPTADSDVDLMVVMPTSGQSHKRAARIREILPSEIPMDILVRTPRELAYRLSIRDFFMRELIEKGIVLHDSRNARVGRAGRVRLRRRLDPAALT
jgi:predicted nucleotidyltransferase